MAIIRYKSLNDAAMIYEGFLPGTTEVWYFRNRLARHLAMGLAWIQRHPCGYFPNPLNLAMTHILVGRIKEVNKPRIVRVMQAETWSPNGEAKQMLAKMAVKHTSMAVGDVIVVDQKAYFVDIKDIVFLGWVDRDTV